VQRRHLAEAWGSYLGRLPWQFSATLTFDPKKVCPTDPQLASREAFWWVGLVGHLCRRQVIWAYAVERGRSGLWHLHVLLGNAGRPNRRTLEGVWRARNGHAAIKRVHDVPGIALYTTKSAAEGEVVVSDTVTLPMFKTMVTDIVVPMVREGE
jgi:hypothetical protein